MQSTHFAEKLSKTDSQTGEIKSKFKNIPSYLNGKTSVFSRPHSEIDSQTSSAGRRIFRGQSVLGFMAIKENGLKRNH